MKKSLTRKEKMLKQIDIRGEGLELGPLCWPLVTKKEANIHYVDHTTREELIKIYKGDKGVVSDLITEVDYPLHGHTLSQVIPKNKKFDYIIASHVIEHIPDMVRWFQDLSSVLKVGGVVSLAVPDKRYTFDIDRNPSVPGEVVGAYLDTYTRPSSATLFDYASNFRLNISAEKIWDGELYLNSTAPHRNSLQQSLMLCEENKKQYVDTHCFVFTPYSFMKIIEALIELDLFDFKITSFFPTDANQYEFLVSLQKVDARTKRRERLESVPKLPRDPYSREFEAKTRQLEDSVQALERSLQSVQSELQHVLHSRSWRLTRPVRHSVRIAKKLRHVGGKNTGVH